MKAIMISIKPEWVAKILNGEKTIEIRKTMPKCDLPIDVYIYCTKDNKTKLSSNSLQYYVIDNKDYKDYLGNWNGKVVAKFTLNKVKEIKSYECPEHIRENACLFAYELIEYLVNDIGYAWHISNLVIFDKPKELSEFKSYKKNIVNTKINGMVFETELDNSLIKAPQSFCYVEELL